MVNYSWDGKNGVGSQNTKRCPLPQVPQFRIVKFVYGSDDFIEFMVDGFMVI